LVKRALVVDDSKSARAFLAKLLEEQQVQVDSAETAEQALEYLNHTRPDVIFMDHLMPGMDGFQAVQAIKANPRTAEIPVLMYTSQEGELYLGQARALGATGVLSKTMAAADVRAVLKQLQLVDLPVPPVAMPVETLVAPSPATAAVSVQPVAAPPPSVVIARDPAVEELLKAEVAALRLQISEELDAHSQKVVREVQTIIRESKPATPMVPLHAPEPPRQSMVAWLLALAASIAAAALGALLWQGQQQLDSLRTELMDSKSTVALLTARLAPPVEQVAVPSRPADAMQVLQVPFGEQPLAGARVDALREFASRIAALGQKGTIEVRRYAGRFCLSSNGTGGYVPADSAAPAAGCELVAEATDPALGSAGVESAAFTAMLAEVRKQHSALFNIDVGVGHGEASGSAYPDAGTAASRAPTAGEWNAAATSNNRVEISWHPT
jgi:CheY-like chemotaxis protein